MADTVSRPEASPAHLFVLRVAVQAALVMALAFVWDLVTGDTYDPAKWAFVGVAMGLVLATYRHLKG